MKILDIFPGKMTGQNITVFLTKKKDGSTRYAIEIHGKVFVFRCIESCYAYAMGRGELHYLNRARAAEHRVQRGAFIMDTDTPAMPAPVQPEQNEHDGSVENDEIA